MNNKEVNWGPTIFLITYQVILLAVLPFYFYYTLPSISMLVVSFILLYLTGLSITAGYHRLYAHKTYRTNVVIEAIILFFASMAGQGSALRWGFDHRLHHAYVDTDDDPYSIKKGFWYAHFLWIIEKPRKIDPKVVPDLMKNKLVMFQHRYVELCLVVTNAIAFFAVGALLNDYLGAFVISLWLRMFALHHFTWFINSLAHTWGDKPFSQEQSAVNNYVISLLTFGEGYHNYHHTFANDYRNGIRWYHFDPTKWLIWTLNKFGLAYDLKFMNSYSIKRKLVLEHKNLLLQRIRTYWNVKTDELEQQVNEISEKIVENISQFNQLKEKYRDLKRNVKRKSQEYNAVKALRLEMKSMKKRLQADWRKWWALSRTILRKKPPGLSQQPR